MRYRAVLFDLDGTLLNTLEDIADATNAALRQLGFPEYPLEPYKLFVGDGVETLIRRVLPTAACTAPLIAQCATLMRAEYGQRWKMKTRPYEGVSELLDELTARGIKMAVLSNKPAAFTRLCVSELLARWEFAVVVGETPAVPKKPDPGGALQIARQLGLAPAEFVYLGDTNTDMQTAVGAGMFAVGALWGFRTPEELLANGAKLLITKPLELLDVFHNVA